MDSYWWLLVVAVVVICSWLLIVWARPERDAEPSPAESAESVMNEPVELAESAMDEPGEVEADDDTPTLWEAGPHRLAVPEPNVERDDDVGLWDPPKKPG